MSECTGCATKLIDDLDAERYEHARTEEELIAAREERDAAQREADEVRALLDQTVAERECYRDQRDAALAELAEDPSNIRMERAQAIAAKIVAQTQRDAARGVLK